MTPLAHVEIDLARSDRWRSNVDCDCVVCLLHGFGASAQDLVPLSAEIGVARRWLFPHAPVPIGVAGMSYGRAWFPREKSDLEAALFGGYFLSLRSIEPPGLTEAAWEVRSFLEDQGIDWGRLVLGGFSQGAMVVAELLRLAVVTGTTLPRGAILFSGALVAESWWREAHRTAGDGSTGPPGSVSDRLLPPVCAFHGRRDSILPYAEGEALRDQMRASGFAVEWNEFDGGHEIPAIAADRSRRYMESLIGGDGSPA